MTRLNLTLLSILPLLVCAGCATEPALSTMAASPVAGGASFTITRPSAAIYGYVPAEVFLNRERIARIKNGESFSGYVGRGEAVLSVSTPTAPGQTTVKFNAQPGKTYRFVVSPRSEGFTAGLIGAVGGPIGTTLLQAAEGGGVFKIEAEGQ